MPAYLVLSFTTKRLYRVVHKRRRAVNLFKRFVLWALRVEFAYEVRATKLGGRNGCGTLMGRWNKYKDAEKQFKKAIQNKRQSKTVTIRMVCITDAKTVFVEEKTATELVVVGGNQHAMAKDLPYPAPEAFDGKKHMCDTMGGLIMQQQSGMLVPCCSICGQPTD